MWVQVCGVVCPFRGGFHRVHWWQVVRLSGLSSLSGAVLASVVRSLLSIVAYFQPEQGETWQKLYFICSLWCFLGNLGYRKGRKQRYILLLGVVWCCFHPLLWWRWWCPLGAGGAGCRGFRSPAVCVPSLSPCLFVRSLALLVVYYT